MKWSWMSKKVSFICLWNGVKKWEKHAFLCDSMRGLFCSEVMLAFVGGDFYLESSLQKVQLNREAENITLMRSLLSIWN
jgi:hypothetical protein